MGRINFTGDWFFNLLLLLVLRNSDLGFSVVADLGGEVAAEVTLNFYLYIFHTLCVSYKVLYLGFYLMRV